MCFVVVMRLWDFQVIDEVFERQQIIDRIAALSPQQIRVHLWVTTTLDAAFPFVYGLFHAGMALRFLGRWGTVVAVLSLACIPVDLIEGFSQVMLLTGHEGFLTIKTVMTPIKLLLFVPGFLATVVAIVIAASRQRKPRK